MVADILTYGITGLMFTFPFEPRKCFLLALIVVVFIGSPLLISNANSNVQVYLYGVQTSSEFLRVKGDLQDVIGGERMVVYDLDQEDNADRFFNIIQKLIANRIPVFAHICVECPPPGGVFRYDELLTPFIGVFLNGELASLVFYAQNTSFWRIHVDDVARYDQVLVFTPSGDYPLQDDASLSELSELVAGNDVFDSNESNLVPILVGLAVMDSINPCTFAVFTATLLMTIHAYGRKRSAQIGLCFASAVFLGYYLLGVGFSRFLLFIPYSRMIVGTVGLVVSCNMILKGLKRDFSSPLPSRLRRITESLVEKSYSSLAMAFVTGLGVCLTLLPCSSGPYFAGLTLLSDSMQTYYGYLFLALYDFIFVLPLLAIIVLVSVTNSSIHRIKVLRSKRLNLMELISGLLLACISLYLLVT